MNDPLAELANQVEQEIPASADFQSGARVQMLTDLGYLKTELLYEGNATEKAASAFQMFYSDLLASGLTNPQQLENLKAMYGLEAEVKLLEAATDVDEGFRFTSLPRLGDLNLITRIVHYRLALLGFYPGQIDSVFNAYSISGLDKAASLIGQKALDTLNMLGDLQQFTIAFTNAHGYSNSLAVIKIPSSQTADNIPGYSGKFKRRLRDDLRNHPAEFEVLDKFLFFRKDDKVDNAFVNKLADAELNGFILRLIQLHQWMSGYYNGALDAGFGEVSLNSLLNIIHNYRESAGVRISDGEVLVNVTGDYYLFNCLFFLKQYQAESQQQDKSFETLAAIVQSYQNAVKVDDKSDFEKNFRSGMAAVVERQKILPVKKNGVIRRIFFGVRTFFKKAFRFARKIFSWIAKWAEKAIDFLGNLFRMIYAYVKEAVRHFVEGVRFLLGKFPVITSGKSGELIYSNLAADKDGVNIIGNAEPGEIRQHLSSLKGMVSSMKFSLAVIGMLVQVMKTALSANAPVAWPVLILNLGMSFKKVSETYKTVLTI
ncbi:MAG: hypothetical protein IPH20_04870 [Bacteroidales bacterium]|nr:hypothetical protein [Bacteroidales bacterium]